ncbi:MAG: hypothetical protein CMP76_16185 [Flavobacterium sp.]|uniref:hypothetical protein n=1 Tax=Flavobacterium sp. TaxID=239 RepID=UPI000C5A7DEB|nr:hypothetical protein [Flavobacterium sp.]MBF04821.1 hypothetical protein [Flavobacterium sp.]|tara:strand:+ start:16 stop:228 length:213 start_codon:yes stop_codon:yes gene_type:complete
MKKTEYFISVNHNTGQLEQAIKNATEKRDIWIKENEDLIGKVDSEDIKINTWSGNNSNVIITIRFTYYPK